MNRDVPRLRRRLRIAVGAQDDEVLHLRADASNPCAGDPLLDHDLSALREREAAERSAVAGQRRELDAAQKEAHPPRSPRASSDQESLDIVRDPLAGDAVWSAGDQDLGRPDERRAFARGQRAINADRRQ